MRVFTAAICAVRSRRTPSTNRQTPTSTPTPVNTVAITSGLIYLYRETSHDAATNATNCMGT